MVPVCGIKVLLLWWSRELQGPSVGWGEGCSCGKATRCRILICSGQSLVEVSLYLSCRGIGIWFAQEYFEFSNKSITFQAAPQLKPVTSHHHLNVLHILWPLTSHHHICGLQVLWKHLSPSERFLVLSWLVNNVRCGRIAVPLSVCFLYGATGGSTYVDVCHCSWARI